MMPKAWRRSCVRAVLRSACEVVDAHRARALLGARLQLVGMVTRLSNHIRGVLKTFGMLPGSVRGRQPSDERRGAADGGELRQAAQ